MCNKQKYNIAKNLNTNAAEEEGLSNNKLIVTFRSIYLQQLNIFGV